jgi:hypothetical protein
LLKQLRQVFLFGLAWGEIHHNIFAKCFDLNITTRNRLLKGFDKIFSIALFFAAAVTVFGFGLRFNFGLCCLRLSAGSFHW